MNRTRVYVARFAIAIGGYVVAVIMSVPVSAFLMFLSIMLPDEGAWGSYLPLIFYRSVQDLPPIIPYGLFITGIFAFPVFVLTLVVSIAMRWQRWLPFSIAGGLDAVLALGLFGAYGHGSITDLPGGLLLPCVPGGLIGGFAYWLVAGRCLMRWRAGEAI